ncbi:subtilisin-like protein [Penicillium malachiteum]|uniref:subtilisin-like protein n=1 Tax=Penicillium malachiteum TaxID=1324776 RepID=UPI0025485221|nr:subtilisin-like protein [Penicillium malachiteum]KAJ5714792.1 subtilisin-like protein [Penicillium malachiteum]
MEDWTRIGPLDSPTKFPAFQQFFPNNDEVEDSSGKERMEKKRKRTTTEKEAFNWLLRMPRLNQEVDHFIAAGKLSHPSKPVRIAILDTGYDSNAPCFFVPNVMSRMKGWKDFVDWCGEAEDCHGHGTHLYPEVRASCRIICCSRRKDPESIANL